MSVFILLASSWSPGMESCPVNKLLGILGIVSNSDGLPRGGVVILLTVTGAAPARDIPLVIISSLK